MCGIIGIINLKEIDVTNPIKNALRCMRKRGPDDEGAVFIDYNDKVTVTYGNETPPSSISYVKNRYNAKHINESHIPARVALGHRRLSIVDLSPKGHQPMSTEMDRYWLVFNGEIYNYKTIRQQLKNYGYSFNSDSDSEVILAAYRHWGTDCLKHFNGMFALAIYDRKTEQVFIARDRVGIKPLYIYHSKNQVIFASDIKTILSTGLTTRELDYQGLYHNLSFSMTPRPNTCFLDIKSVKPSHFLLVDTKTFEYTEQEYWDIPTGQQDQNMTERDAVDLLESELKRSVGLRLIADVDVGTFMSGGIDSTTISAIASQLHPGIKAFTLGFDKSISQYDEVEEAKSTAKMYDMQHIVSNINADVVINNIKSMVLCYEEPFHHLAANFAISEIVSNNGIKVVLNGLGGDELFAGYGHYDLIGKWRKAKKISPLLKLMPLERLAKGRKLIELLKARDIGEFYASRYSNFTDDKKQKLLGQNFDSLGEIKRQYFKSDKCFTDDIELLSYYDIKSYIGNHHVHRTDQFTMWFSIEGRFPFLDHELIENAFKIPTKYKLRNGVQKYALRKFAEKYISHKSLSMVKKGFGLPLESWYSNQLKGLAADSIEKLIARRIFDNGAVKSVINNGSITQKWQLVMTELWFQEFFDKRVELIGQ